MTDRNVFATICGGGWTSAVWGGGMLMCGLAGVKRYRAARQAV